MCEYSALVNEEQLRWRCKASSCPIGGEIKAVFDHTEDGCSLAQRSWKKERQTCLGFTIKYGKKMLNIVRLKMKNSYIQISVP